MHKWLERKRPRLHLPEIGNRDGCAPVGNGGVPIACTPLDLICSLPVSVPSENGKQRREGQPQKSLHQEEHETPEPETLNPGFDFQLADSFKSCA